MISEPTASDEEARAGREDPLPSWLEKGERQIRALALDYPYATVLGALGAGYVLGGGLPRWAVRALVRDATRGWGAHLLGSVLTELVADVGAGRRPPEPTLIHEEEP